MSKDQVKAEQNPGVPRSETKPSPELDAAPSGVALIAAERERQVNEEGWTPEHDDEHGNDELAQAAACFAWPPMRPLFVKQSWPWDRHWWKPELFGVGATETEKRHARIRVLVKAGALIAAEIDRLHRLYGSEQDTDATEEEFKKHRLSGDVNFTS